MTSFLIDTPYHKRWWLPDGQHQFNSIIYGDECRISITRADTGITVLSHYIKLKDGWQELHDTAVQLAERRFRKHHYDGPKKPCSALARTQR